MKTNVLSVLNYIKLQDINDNFSIFCINANYATGPTKNRSIV